MAVLFALCLWTFLQVLDAGQVDGSAGINPRLIFRPKPQEGNGSVIWFRADDPTSYQYVINDLTKFLEPYKQGSENLVACDFMSSPRDGLVCDVGPRAWYPCSDANDFGYSKSMPCVFLHLNNVYGWTPEYYDNPDALPSEMPDDLRQYIRVIATPKNDFPKEVWVTCEGENPADQENIGPIQYLPRRGFPEYYFPYTGQEGYRNPLVALLLEKPKRGLPIRIKCRAWAHNIKYDQTEGLGFTLFEIMVE